jgi:hypothetical protein
MQFIWQASPKVDEDKILAEENFCDEKLPRVTRGLARQGYFGNEEVFDYTGESLELFEEILLNLRPGDEIVSQLLALVEKEPLKAGTTASQQLEHKYIRTGSITFANATVGGAQPAEGADYIVDHARGVITFTNPLDDVDPGPTITYETYDRLAATSLFQYLQRYETPESVEALIEHIRSVGFVEDPARPEEFLTMRSVQIAQDALVVETMPGQVPLLEGFKMAHRMLDVQRVCLENAHLAARIDDRPWQKDGEDSYEVRRYDGSVPPSRVEHEAK